MPSRESWEDVRTWRGGRVGPFWMAVVPVAALVLFFAAMGAGEQLVGGTLLVLSVIAIAAPIVFVFAAILYTFYRIADRGLSWIEPALSGALRFITAGVLIPSAVVVAVASWAGLPDHVAHPMLVGGVIATGCVIGLLLLSVWVGDSESGVRVTEAGLVLADHETYIPFCSLSRLCLVQHGCVETDLFGNDALAGVVITELRCTRGRTLAAVDRGGELVAEVSLSRYGGFRLECEVVEAFDAWRARRASSGGVSTTWLARGGASLKTWMAHLGAEAQRWARETAYRGAACGVDGLLAILQDTAQDDDVRAGAAYVLLQTLSEDERSMVFECVGAWSPPMVSAMAWCGARTRVRRRTVPFGVVCLSRDDRRMVGVLKRAAWWDLVGGGGKAKPLA